MGLSVGLRRIVHRLGRRHQPVRARAGVPTGASSPPAAAPRPTSPWSPTRPPARGSPTRTIWIPATRSRSWAAPACRHLPGRACWPSPTRDARPRASQPLDSSSPTDTQQALYSLPQQDYNVIESGSNGYSAAAGYNLVTGLGTPVANLVVTDLVAYQGPGTFYAGPTVAALQNDALVNTGASAGAPIDVFSIFDSLTLTSNGIGHTAARGTSSTNRASQAVGATRSSMPRQDRTVANFSEGATLLASAGERPAAPLVLVPPAPESDLASLDLALADESIASLSTNSSMNPVVRIRLDSAGMAKTRETSRATPTPRVPAIDAAALDALLRAGWRARSSWIADRPRATIKKFL